MADLSILAGTTSQSIMVDLYILATGAPQTGLVFNSAGLKAYYSFAGASTTAVAITLATLAAVNSAYSSGGFKEIDATNMPGLYRLDLPNAALAAASGRQVVVTLTGFSGMATTHKFIELTGWNNQDAVRGGMTAMPNAAADAAGGLPISDAGGLDLDARLDAAISSRMATYAQPTGFLAATFPAGTVANTTNITAGTITTVTNLTNAPTAGDLTATMKTSVTTAATAATPIAASVTGNVGGNVTGSVGSVVGLTAANLDVAVSTRLATAGYTAPPSAAQNATELLDQAAGVEANLTVRDYYRLGASALLGKASGLATTTVIYRDTNDTVDRITATVDASGNRSAVTLDPT